MDNYVLRTLLVWGQRVRDAIAQALLPRLLRYYRYMSCRPDREAIEEATPRKLVLDWKSLHPITITMLMGFSLERSLKADALVGASLKKPVNVVVFEDLLASLWLSEAAVPIPSLLHADYFPGGCVEKNIVYEVWAPVPPYIRGPVVLNTPSIDYVLDYRELVKSISELLVDSREAYIYVLSKFAQPGLIARFVEAFSDKEVEVHIAVEEPVISKFVKEKIENMENVYIVPTRSHRKLLLLFYKDYDGVWNVIGYKGSMNIFYPGVDDYLESVNDWDDLRRLIHGIIRAFLIV